PHELYLTAVGNYSTLAATRVLTTRTFRLGRMRPRRFLRCFELRQVRVDVGRERRVLAQSREMAHGPRELGGDLRSENRIEALLFERPRPRLLVEEETHLGDEADVREGDIAPHQELAVGRQRLLDSGGVGRESVSSSRMDLGRDSLAHQGQQIDLRVSREHEACIEEAVHPRRLVRTAAIEWESALTQAGDRPHDAVRFEDADLAVRAERRRHGAEGMRLHEGVGLAEAGPPKTDLADANFRRRRGLVAREWAGVEVPQPRLQLLRRASSHLDLDAAQTRGDGRFPDPRIR